MAVKVRVDDMILGDGTASFVGAIVRVLPTKPGGRDGYLARVRRIDSTRTGVEVEVGGIDVTRCNQSIRTLPPARLRQPTALELRTVGER